mmetsp:Transcript_23890/g.71829  ORF Transcript_23890/g.71829 Transcript_23890/m.71829 type:complete len:258 (-) Transcript_23890:288-1061(-)
MPRGRDADVGRAARAADGELFVFKVRPRGAGRRAAAALHDAHDLPEPAVQQRVHEQVAAPDRPEPLRGLAARPRPGGAGRDSRGLAAAVARRHRARRDGRAGQGRRQDHRDGHALRDAALGRLSSSGRVRRVVAERVAEPGRGRCEDHRVAGDDVQDALFRVHDRAVRRRGRERRRRGGRSLAAAPDGGGHRGRRGGHRDAARRAGPDRREAHARDAAAVRLVSRVGRARGLRPQGHQARGVTPVGGRNTQADARGY